MALRNPFRRHGRVRHHVHQAIPHSAHAEAGHEAGHAHPFVRVQAFPDIPRGHGRPPELSARHDLPKIVLELPELPHDASPGQRVVHDIQRTIVGNVWGIENEISQRRAELKRGTILDSGQEPGFQGVSRGPNRAGEVSIPIISKIPIIGGTVNYIAGLARGVITGRHLYGTRSVERRINPAERAAAEERIDELLHLREQEVAQFQVLLDMNREAADAYAKTHHGQAFKKHSGT